MLDVPSEIAPLIELALGDAAERFVVRDAARLDAARAGRAVPFAGRVSFLPLAERDPLADGDDTTTIDRWVTCCARRVGRAAAATARHHPPG